MVSSKPGKKKKYMYFQKILSFFFNDYIYIHTYFSISNNGIKVFYFILWPHICTNSVLWYTMKKEFNCCHTKGAEILYCIKI